MKNTMTTILFDYKQASWSGGNAFVSGAVDLRFTSQAGQIGNSITNDSLPLCNYFRMMLCCLGAMTRRWATPTRYTFRRITASMKYLISIPNSAQNGTKPNPACKTSNRMLN